MRRVLAIGEQIPDEEVLRGSAALKALANGDATAEQQVFGIRFIVDVIAGTDRQDYALASDSETMAWHNGRRYVGLEIEKMISHRPMIPAPYDMPARTITEAQRRRGSQS